MAVAGHYNCKAAQMTLWRCVIQSFDDGFGLEHESNIGRVLQNVHYYNII